VAGIILSASSYVLMLTYLLGDVLRIYPGHFKAGKIAGRPVTQNLLLGIAILITVPIAMVFLSLTLSYPLNRLANIIPAIAFLGFNLIGLPTYSSAYDRFLMIVGVGFNVLTIWYAWQWQS